MKRLTLDTNAIIELSQATPPSALSDIVELAGADRVVLQVAAIAGSERQKGGGQLRSFKLFIERLKQVGLGSARILKPLAYLNLCYVGWAIPIPVDGDPTERAIHSILFPRIAFAAKDHCLASDLAGRKRWRNAKCDVLALWCHIYHGGDVFVTRDRNYFKTSKNERLEVLGAGVIARPEEALKLVSQ